MYLEIKKNKIKNFEKQIEVLAPWMHSFKFTENLIVGYYKYEGIGDEITFINSKSSKQDKKKIKNAYLKRNHDLEKDFFLNL